MNPQIVPKELLCDWHVLVVEDDPSSMQVASMLLSFYGANVHTAANGEEGCKKAEEVQPKFILSDLSMPVMDGWAMIEKLQTNRALADIPVIALTAHAMVGDREKAIAAGFFNYLTKPLTPATFIVDLLSVLTAVPELNEDLERRMES
jgi:CheY-like chemotaxis protein